jgi:hypothetical protein
MGCNDFPGDGYRDWTDKEKRGSSDLMRVWHLGDPEPSDHPDIVDDDSVTWSYVKIEEGWWAYCQQDVSINGNSGEGSKTLPWRDLLEEFGPVREVTKE